MARKCSTPGCAFTLPDKYPLDKCPWHLAPGKGPVKIAAAITIAAAGFGGGIAYKKFRAYLRNKEERKQQREARQKKSAAVSAEKSAASGAGKASTTKKPRARKKTATKSKKKTATESRT